MPNATKRISALLEDKNENDIIAPRPASVEWNGKAYRIKPFSDASLIQIGDRLLETGNLFANLVRLLPTEGNNDYATLAQSAIGLLPELLRLLLPYQSEIIALALDVEPSVIADAMPLAKKAEALRLILAGNDIAAILKNYYGITTLFQNVIPANETTVAG